MILIENETSRLRREQLGNLTYHEAEADTRRRQRRVISRLIDAGANPDGPGLWSKSRRLLLFAASQQDYTAYLAALLEKRANARMEDSQGDRMDATQLLLDHGYSPDMADEAGETALHLAAQKGSLEQLRLYLAHSQLPANGAVRQPNNQGESPLHYAAALGRHDVVEYLLA
ncbi:hypothetical protein PG994_006954 [Apiospora phragmitis]|uniref:Ankyrin repeat domain-containing protein n=1 Tax=Apiospora phragmitis TaxID=2905665 RepID=A0ABR1VKC8_9PEZI